MRGMTPARRKALQAVYEGRVVRMRGTPEEWKIMRPYHSTDKTPVAALDWLREQGLIYVNWSEEGYLFGRARLTPEGKTEHGMG